MSVKLTDKQLEKILSVLMPISENRFLMVADTNKYELIPVFNTSGTISEIKLITNGGKPDVFVPVKPPVDSPEKLSEYAGTYYSDEFNADYKISLKGNNLSLQNGENFEPPLTAWYADFLTLRVDRLIFLLFAMIKEKSRNLCLIQQLMNEMLKESLLSDDSRIIEQS